MFITKIQVKVVQVAKGEAYLIFNSDFKKFRVAIPLELKGN